MYQWHKSRWLRDSAQWSMTTWNSLSCLRMARTTKMMMLTLLTNQKIHLTRVPIYSVRCRTNLKTSSSKSAKNNLTLSSCTMTLYSSLKRQMRIQCKTKQERCSMTRPATAARTSTIATKTSSTVSSVLLHSAVSACTDNVSFQVIKKTRQKETSARYVIISSLLKIWWRRRKKILRRIWGLSLATLSILLN